MSGQANCPNNNWQTCTFAVNTGAYINISDTRDVWVGLAEAPSQVSAYPNGSFYAIMLVVNSSSAGPAQVGR